MPEEITYNNSNIFFLPRFQKLKEVLKRMKSAQDVGYVDQEHYQKILYDTQLMGRRFKRELRNAVGDQQISMAWAKLFEMLVSFPLLDKKAEEIKTFDLCSAPGMWTKATIWFVDNHTDAKKFEWKATSLKPEHSRHAFGDDYKIIEKNPDSFVFGEAGTGDITDSRNVREFWKMGPFDLVTSDCGVHKDYRNPEDFLEEEARNVNVFFGALLTSLGTLKKGGSMVMKTFTVLDDAHVSMVYLIMCVFEKVYFAKPMTSKPANSEVYIVAEKYKKNIPNEMMDFLINVLDNFDPYKSLWSRDEIPEPFLDELLEIQTQVIKKTIDRLEKVDHYYRHPDALPDVDKDRQEFEALFAKNYGKFLKHPLENTSGKNVKIKINSGSRSS